MKTQYKTGIIITRNELINSWIESVVSLFGDNCCFFIVDDLVDFKLLDKIFLNLNFKVFGKEKRVENSDSTIIYNNNLEDCLKDCQTILNFTSHKLTSSAQIINYFEFLISEKPYGLYNVLSHTLTSYKKVKLVIKYNNELLKVSTVRLDPFSITKNIQLILASFLALLNSNTKRGNDSSSSFLSINDSRNIILKDYLRYLGRFFVKLNYYFFYNEQWILGYSFNTETFGVDLNNDFKLIPPKDRFWADPVVIFENEKLYVFIEELVYKNKIAHLSVFELNTDGSITEPHIILKKPYHLSYPFIFKHEDKYYMIPETAQNNDIQLYESVSFPLEWKFKQTLMKDVKASDTTLLYKHEMWWLFTSLKKFDKGTYDNDLSIFYSDSLFSSNWISHFHKPVKQDIFNARQGGPFFSIKGNDYRVSQNCETNYGYGFNINKLENLTGTQFTEKTEYSFVPENVKNLIGSHTYNHIEGKLRMYDLLTRTFKY